MPIETDAVGARLGPHEWTLTPRQTMAYAASVGDLNPRYFDDTGPEPVPAPPLFAVCVEWALRPAMLTALALSPDEARRVVHATHDLTLLRLPRAGDVLVTRGRIVSVEARRPGAYVLVRFDTVDAADRPVLTTYHGSLFRGVACHGAEETLESAPPLPAVPATEAPRWQAELPVARQAPHLYTECSGIWNPIHTERAYALAAGLPDLILHGTQTLSLAAREIVDREAGGDPTRLARVACRFSGMVIPGTRITVRALGETASAAGRALAFEVRNAAGQLAIRHAVALLRP